MPEKSETQKNPKKAPSVFSLLGQYRGMILWLVALGISANGLTLFLPKLISGVIDAFIKGVLNVPALIFQFGGISLGILLFTYIQSIVQTYASERVARDLRLQI